MSLYPYILPTTHRPVIIAQPGVVYTNPAYVVQPTIVTQPGVTRVSSYGTLGGFGAGLLAGDIIGGSWPWHRHHHHHRC